jgi:alanine dehydrogenase
VVLNKKDFKNMQEHIPGTDILVNGINWPMEKRGKEFIITRDMLKLFKKGAVLLDLISNPPGQSPIETMHPTTLDNIFYVVNGVIHTSCWAWPGLDPVNISRRYSIQVAPILKEIADKKLNNLPEYISQAVHKEF